MGAPPLPCGSFVGCIPITQNSSRIDGGTILDHPQHSTISGLHNRSHSVARSMLSPICSWNTFSTSNTSLSTYPDCLGEQKCSNPTTFSPPRPFSACIPNRSLVASTTRIISLLSTCTALHTHGRSETPKIQKQRERL